MNLAVSYQLGRQLHMTTIGADFAIQRRRALKKVDKELSRGNFKTALSLVKQLQGKPGGLRGFGATKQVPKRLSSLDELKLDAVELSSLKSLFDSVMDSIESCSRFDSLDEVPSDRVESLVEDEGYGSLCEENYFMCMQHEAGHFLVGYLLGVLPRGYEVPSIEALRQDEFTAGRVKFVGFEFLKEVALSGTRKKDIGHKDNRAKRGEISSKTLNNFSCVILGGLVAAHLVYGYSEGHDSDINKLERVFRWLGYRKSEAVSQVRWAALNTIFISQRTIEARSRVAEAMAAGRSVGLCIEAIENAIHEKGSKM